MTIYEENPVLKILQSLGNISMDTFSERLRLQKMAYLSQQLHSDGGFFFTYYHYGPYSTSLTKLLYKGVETNSFSEQIELTEQEAETIRQINELVGDQIGNPFSLELFSTIWYLLPSRETTNTEQEETIQKITETKPRFDPVQVRETMNRIIEYRQHHGFFN